VDIGVFGECRARAGGWMSQPRNGSDQENRERRNPERCDGDRVETFAKRGCRVGLTNRRPGPRRRRCLADDWLHFAEAHLFRKARRIIRIVKRERYQFDSGHHRAMTRPWPPHRAGRCGIEFLFVLEQRIAGRRFRRVIRSGIMWKGNSRVAGFLESHNLVQQGNRQVYRDGDPADPDRTCHRKYI
jgi:hypothetical protein